MIERRRREDRGARGAEGSGAWGRGIPLPTGGGVWGGDCEPSAENFWTLELKTAGFGAFWVLFLPLQLPVLQAKPMILALRIGKLRMRSVHVTSLT